MSQLTYGPEDAAAEPFQYEVPLTAFVISARNAFLHLNPAGTLATGTVLLPANALDGQKFGIVSTQTQTALTMTPAEGDTIANPATALVALAPLNWRYHKATSTWRRCG
jgi:hypothetical protein